MNQQISDFLSTHVESSVLESEIGNDMYDHLFELDDAQDTQTQAMSMYVEINDWARRELSSRGFHHAL